MFAGIILKMKLKNKYLLLGFLIITALTMSIFSSINMSKAENIVGGNYKNVTVRTYVNITNARPEVLSVYVYQETNYTLRNITLSAGSTRIITCNATVRDWNGYNDIAAVNASIWHSTVAYTSPDNNNSHYTNASCTSSGNDGEYLGYYICTFNTFYYANNGTWTCNVTAKDYQNKTAFLTNTTTMLPLYALNLTDGIDYGNMQVDDYSSADILANITNFGNMNINISIEGYGVTRGDGLAMNCSINGNISIENERFALNASSPWDSMTPLTNSSALINDLTMPKQTVSGSQIINTTYWKLYIPPNPAGNCSGYVLFSAET